MYVTEAAEAWKAYKRKLKALGPEPKAAENVLKQWFREHPKQPVYKGIAYSSVPTERLVPELARAELDPKALARCTVPGTRETLSLLEPLAPAKAKKAAKPSRVPQHAQVDQVGDDRRSE